MMPSTKNIKKGKILSITLLVLAFCGEFRVIADFLVDKIISCCMLFPFAWRQMYSIGP
jgi:hypothetical protein